jgi:hypothetical protein
LYCQFFEIQVEKIEKITLLSGEIFCLELGSIGYPKINYLMLNEEM